MQPDNTIPVFHMRAVQNMARSRDEGRPVFEEYPYVEILVPGSRDKPVSKVRQEHKDRWPQQWAAFETKREACTVGTPIEQWPQLNVAQVATLKALHIKSVENLANITDGIIPKLGPGGRELVKSAQRFLDTAKATAPDDRLAKLEARLAELEAENTALKAAKPRRGRPPKVKPAHADPIEA